MKEKIKVRQEFIMRELNLPVLGFSERVVVNLKDLKDE